MQLPIERSDRYRRRRELVARVHGAVIARIFAKSRHAFALKQRRQTTAITHLDRRLSGGGAVISREKEGEKKRDEKHDRDTSDGATRCSRAALRRSVCSAVWRSTSPHRVSRKHRVRACSRGLFSRSSRARLLPSKIYCSRTRIAKRLSERASPFDPSPSRRRARRSSSVSRGASEKIHEYL